MLILKKKALNIRLPLLEHLNRMALSKDGTALLLRLLEQCSQLLSFHYHFGPEKHSDLAPQRQEISVENVTSGLVPQGQKASDYDNSDPIPLIEEYYTPTHGQAEENNNDQAPNASFQEVEFINPFCTRTRDHPLEKVHGNPTMPVQTRRQLATDPESLNLCVDFLACFISGVELEVAVRERGAMREKQDDER
ncbi:hypothetical protein Tco_1318613 [Tanacetum coccineum]